MDAPIETKSKYNLSLTSLFSIRQLLNDCNQYSQLAMHEYNVQYLNLWKSSIFALYREIAPKLKPEEDGQITKLMSKYKKVSGVLTQSLNPQNPTLKINPTLYHFYWKLNHKLELKLRRFADKHNMLIVDEDDARWGIG